MSDTEHTDEEGASESAEFILENEEAPGIFTSETTDPIDWSVAPEELLRRIDEYVEQAHENGEQSG